jgi:hypothetical protein
LIAMFYSAATILFPLLADHRDWLLEKDFFFMDQFTSGALRRDVHWSGYEWLVGLFLILGVGFAAIQILRRNSRGMLILHLVVLLFVSSSLYLFTGRIEGYTQRSAIRFYQGLRGQDVYVRPLGYNSYSHLYYFDIQPGEKKMDFNQMIEQDLDKDAYFVIRLDEKDYFMEKYPSLELLNEKDGYAFTIKRASIK